MHRACAQVFLSHRAFSSTQSLPLPTMWLLRPLPEPWWAWGAPCPQRQ